MRIDLPAHVVIVLRDKETPTPVRTAIAGLFNQDPMTP